MYLAMIFQSKIFENYLASPYNRKLLGLKMIPFIKLENNLK